MITILVVGPREMLAGFTEPDPSVEVLVAGDLEDALEKLARNRRVDAVLLLGPHGDAAALAREILAEDPAGPPLFAPAASGTIPQVETLPDAEPEALAVAIARRLET